MDELRAALPMAALLLAPVSAFVGAQQFRIETEVFAEDDKEPRSESLTIFDGDVVYDFLLGAMPETTMFDIRRGRIVSLDPQRKVQTSLTTENLLEFCAAIRSRAATEGQDQLFQPRFEILFDESGPTVTLSSEAITYRARGVAAKDVEAVKRFQQFADWYARLNAVRPGNPPPFGRIELNRALAERNLIPQEIERTVVIRRTVGSKRMVARSVHEINWLISNSDRNRIETVGNQLTSFAQVALKDYWPANQTARAK